MNKVELIGRLTKDLELKQGGQTPLVKFTLAVDRQNKEGGAEFIPCTAFGKTAEFMAKYLGKGRKVGLEGHIQTGSYDDKDGKKIYTVEVIAERVEFCDSVKAEAKSDVPAGFEKLDQEDIPF